MLARKHECAGTCTPCMHSEVGRLAISRQAESTIVEKPGTCVKGPVFAQDGKEGPIQLFPTWAEPEKSLCTGGKRWRVSHHSCPSSQGPLPMVTSGSRSQEYPGPGLSVATGRRCLALQRPRCSWRPAAPAGRGLWPVSVPASRQSDRQSATCNMSGRPEPGNGYEKWKETSLTDQRETHSTAPELRHTSCPFSPTGSITGFLYYSNSLNILDARLLQTRYEFPREGGKQEGRV